MFVIVLSITCLKVCIKKTTLVNDVIKTVPMIRIAVSKFALCTERKDV